MGSFFSEIRREITKRSASDDESSAGAMYFREKLTAETEPIPELTSHRRSRRSFGQDVHAPDLRRYSKL
jgi:hypothetical protein